MSFLRPELHDQLHRWREVLILLVIIAMGLWIWARPGWLIAGGFGLVAAICALGLLVPAIRRVRFRTEANGPGIVALDEARLVYMGPVTGGMMALDELTRLALRNAGSSDAAWVLKSSDTLLTIPVNASGAEVLIDAFAALPGFRLNRLLEVKTAQLEGETLIWRRDVALEIRKTDDAKATR